MKTRGFPKSQRLCGRSAIQQLFSEGKRIRVHPFQLIFSVNASARPDEDLKILISIPKRIIRKATQRNRIRRQIREAWRISHDILSEKISNLSSETQTKALHIAFIYKTEKSLSWKNLLSAMELSLNQLAGKLPTP